MIISLISSNIVFIQQFPLKNKLQIADLTSLLFSHMVFKKNTSVANNNSINLHPFTYT